MLKIDLIRTIAAKKLLSVVVCFACLVILAGIIHMPVLAANGGSADQKAPPSKLSPIQLTRAEQALAPNATRGRFAPMCACRGWPYDNGLTSRDVFESPGSGDVLAAE